MDTSNKNDKAKVVSTIDVNIEWLEQGLDSHLNCVLCGESLNFQHKTDFINNTVCEDAKCPSCGVRTRQSSYSLQ